MNWKKYEKEIHAQFQKMYPDAKITHNVKVPGRYSKIERQIDVLVEDYAAGEKVRIIIDGKYRKRNIDVKEVESFIGFMKDVEADKGLLITQKDYSQAAIDRAHNDPDRIELDILNFEELKEFQGFVGFPYSGRHGVIMPAPFGWVIDANKREGSLACLFQRGLSLAESQDRKEWMYVNIFSKTEEIDTLDKFLKFHEQDTLDHFPKATFTYSSSIKRERCKTTVRSIEIKSYPTTEYTGFVEFDDFIFFCVLFTPEQLRSKNLKKLEYIMAKVLPFNVDLESLADSHIQEGERLYKKAKTNQDKAEIAIKMAVVYLDMTDIEKAKEKYQLSIEVFPENYGARKALLEIEMKHGKGKEVDLLVQDFFALAPTNQQILWDLLDIFLQYEKEDYLIQFLENKIVEHGEDSEIIGNIHFSLGDLYNNLRNKEKLIKHMTKAKEHLSKCYASDHEAFTEIESVMNELNKMDTSSSTSA